MWLWTSSCSRSSGVSWESWGGGFAITSVRAKNQDRETEQLTGGQRMLWQSRGFHVTCIPVQQCGHQAAGERSSEAPPSHAPLRECWQDYVLNPEGWLRAPRNCLLWCCYWSLWYKGVSQACWWVIWYRGSLRQELHIAPSPSSRSWTVAAI